MIHRPIGSKNIVTPNIFASYRIRDYPRAGLRCHPWRMTETQGVLVNAFDLLANPRTKKYTEEIRTLDGKLHDYIEFAGPIMLDSGAFNFLQHPQIAISPLDVLNIGIEMLPDISIVLDHPFPPHSTPDQIAIRWENTLKNTRTMLEELANRNGSVPPHYRLMPVLHGHNKDTLQRALDDLADLFHDEPTIVGIGSLAPLAKNGNTQTVIDVLLAARKMLPNSHIHCFSMGSALLMLLAFYCGADTVDSQTWIMSAAFKQAQMPGFHITRLSYQEMEKDTNGYKATRYSFASQLLKLVQEDNFIVKNWESDQAWAIQTHSDAMKYVDYLEDKEGDNRVHRRACHNLYSFNFEANRYRHERVNGEIEEFIRTRVKGTKYAKVYEYAVECKQRLQV